MVHIQARDWSLHKSECEGIAKMHPQGTPTETMRLLIRTLHRRNTRKQVCVSTRHKM